MEGYSETLAVKNFCFLKASSTRSITECIQFETTNSENYRLSEHTQISEEQFHTQIPSNQRILQLCSTTHDFRTNFESQIEYQSTFCKSSSTRNCSKPRTANASRYLQSVDCDGDPM
ncbi:hypothetical protein CDAR_463121 [Caerostris darwini]|uniref:Uncharacterized protein n=1 Tax=Caerostris darwini TaxID=1538125 RepID=A0AAV4QB67_9ARAC|nr:hypothetical protein CDAR_463121 [Caerostris darwini]